MEGLGRLPPHDLAREAKGVKKAQLKQKKKGQAQDGDATMEGAGPPRKPVSRSPAGQTSLVARGIGLRARSRSVRGYGTVGCRPSACLRAAGASAEHSTRGALRPLVGGLRHSTRIVPPELIAAVRALLGPHVLHRSGVLGISQTTGIAESPAKQVMRGTRLLFQAVGLPVALRFVGSCHVAQGCRR